MNNETFWDERYAVAPSLGSGPGSRGYCAWLKERVIGNIIRLNEIKSIIDIGCGDMYWLDPELLYGIDFIGIDISEIITIKNRLRFPMLTFLKRDITKHNVSIIASDLILCLDVLLHQCSKDSFLKALHNILHSLTAHGLISYPATEGVQTNILPVEPTPDIVEQQEQFDKMDRTLGDRIPRGNVACFGNLERWIYTLDPTVSVKRAFEYRGQTVFQITRTNNWLDLGLK